MIDRLSDAQLGELCELYQGAWWSRGRTLADVRRVVEGSDIICAVVAGTEASLVGFCRVLADGVYKALVFDVIVSIDHRGRGVGRMLMDAVCAHPVLDGVEMIELYCQPEMESFYSRWGFTTDCGGTILLRRRREIAQ